MSITLPLLLALAALHWPLTASRCIDPGGKVIANPRMAPAGCPAGQGRPAIPPGGRLDPVLALSSSRSQRLITEVLAAVMEDLLGLNVVFRDISDQPPNASYADVRSGCYDVDVENVVMSLDLEDSAQPYMEAMSESSGWAVDAGTIGYAVEPGLFVARDEGNGSAEDGPPYFDWYRTYLDVPGIQDLFPPLPNFTGTRWQTVCSAAWNSKHSLVNGQPWCNLDGDFVPEHCKGSGSCGEIYSPPPRLSMGSIEALIETYQLPFKVVYITEAEHSKLPASGPSYLAVGYLPGTPVTGKRIYFPHVSPELCGPGGRRGATRPGVEQLCDFPVVRPRKMVSQALRDTLPWAYVVLTRLSFTREQLADLLDLDERLKGAGACAYFLNHIQDFRLFGGRCGENTLNPAAATRCECPPGNGWFFGGCNPCPEGYYSDSLTLLCNSCPDKALSDPAVTSSLSCKCQKGYFWQATDPAPGRCADCAKIPGGEGAVCTGDMADPADVIEGAPTWQGPSGVPHYLPYAKVGYKLFGTGGPSEPGGYNVSVVKCPIPHSCLGLNKCADGMHGSLCHICDDGWVRWKIGEPCRKCNVADALASLAGATGLSVCTIAFLSSVMARHAVKHDQIVTVIIRLCIRFSRVTSPVEKVLYQVPFLMWLSWLSIPSDIANAVWYSLLCLFEVSGMRANKARSMGIYTVMTVLPAVTVISTMSIFFITRFLRRQRIAKLQRQVDDLYELVHLCDEMVELRVRKKESVHMGVLKSEFQHHLADLEHHSRIGGIWRSVYPRNKCDPGSTRGIIREFLVDSMNLFFVLFTYLYPLILPKMVSTLVPLRIPNAPPELQGLRVEVAPELVFLGSEHSFHFFCVLVLASIYGIGLPAFIVGSIFRYQDSLATDEVSSCIGYLYHGLKVEPPFCYGQLLELGQELFVYMITEGFFRLEEEFAAYCFGGIMCVVLQTWYSPLEDKHHRTLAHLEFLVYLVWSCVGTATTVTVQQDIYAGLELEFFTRILCTLVSVVYFYFWVAALWQIWKEIQRLVFRQITEAGGPGTSSAQSWGPWWTKMWLCCREFAGQDLPKMTATLAKIRLPTPQRTGLGESSIDASSLVHDMSEVSHEPSMEAQTSTVFRASSTCDEFHDFVQAHWISIRILLYLAGNEARRRKHQVGLTIGARREADRDGGPQKVLKEIVVHTAVDSPQNEGESQEVKDLRVYLSNSLNMETRMIKGLRGLRIEQEAEEKTLSRAELLKARACWRCCRRSAETMDTITVSTVLQEFRHGLPARFEAVKKRGTMWKRDLAALAEVLCEALKVLAVTHNLNSLPFCTLEFVLVGALCSMHEEQSWRQREALVNFAVNHPGGKAQGLTDLFHGQPWNPRVGIPCPARYDLTWRLQKAAKGDFKVLTRVLTVGAIERYVLHLKSKSTEAVCAELEAYASIATQDNERSKDTVQTRERGTQTWNRLNQGVQTDFRNSHGTSTDPFELGLMEDPEVARCKVQAAVAKQREQLREVLLDRRQVREALQILQEQTAVAEREADLLKEEAFRMRGSAPPLAARRRSSIVREDAKAAVEAAAVRPAFGTRVQRPTTPSATPAPQAAPPGLVPSSGKPGPYASSTADSAKTQLKLNRTSGFQSAGKKVLAGIRISRLALNSKRAPSPGSDDEGPTETPQRAEPEQPARPGAASSLLASGLAVVTHHDEQLRPGAAGRGHAVSPRRNSVVDRIECNGALRPMGRRTSVSSSGRRQSVSGGGEGRRRSEDSGRQSQTLNRPEGGHSRRQSVSHDMVDGGPGRRRSVSESKGEGGGGRRQSVSDTRQETGRSRRQSVSSEAKPDGRLPPSQRRSSVTSAHETASPDASRRMSDSSGSVGLEQRPRCVMFEARLQRIPQEPDDRPAFKRTKSQEGGGLRFGSTKSFCEEKDTRPRFMRTKSSLR